MSKAKQLLEAIYKVYNPQEENKETARTYDSENLRNMFIGTIFGGDHQDTIKNLRDCINKMSDAWVAEFLKVINGDVVEQVNESIAQLKYFTFKKDNLKTSDDFKKAQEEMKKALREEPNMDAQQVIKKDMETLKSWEQETIQGSFNEEKTEFHVGDFVYDGTGAFDKGFGLIEEINGDTAQVRIYRTKYGAFSGAVQSTELKNLKDGNAVINQEIQSLERKIQTQKNIRDQIMAIAKGEV